MWAKYLMAFSCVIYCSLYIFRYQNLVVFKDKDIELTFFTAATRETKGFQSFIRSAKHFNLDFKVLGMEKMGQKWPGDSQKIFFYRKALFPYKERNDMIVLFSDGYDVIFNANSSEILSRFLSFHTKVLFSAEKNCSPDKSLATKYPSVEKGDKYLNSGLFMGYAPYIYGILVHNMKIGMKESDQLYFSKIFIDNKLRKNYKIQLDTTSRIFQSLYLVKDEVYIDTSSGKAEIVNKAYSTNPCVIHGNGKNSKKTVFELGEILAKSWNPHPQNRTAGKGKNREPAQQKN